LTLDSGQSRFGPSNRQEEETSDMARLADAPASSRHPRRVELISQSQPQSPIGVNRVLEALHEIDAATDEILRVAVSDPERAGERAADVVRHRAHAIGFESEAFRLALVDRLTQGAWLTEYAPLDAIDAMLRALVALTPVVAASLWARDVTGRLERLAAAGPQGKRAKQEARRLLLDDEEGTVSGGHMRTLPVTRWGQLVAALVLRLGTADDEDVLPAAARAASSAAVLIERQRQLEAGESREALLRAAADRRFARLALDVHDGPLQDVAALLSDVRLYRDQLLRALRDTPNGPILVARTDDFEARLIAIDRDLRGLAQSFEAPSLLAQQLPEMIETEVAVLRARLGIQASLTCELDTERLTPSQQICLIRLVQETLSNVRDHSDARHVDIELTQRDGHFHLLVKDDGVGFDVERTLVRVARQGRLGLVGMAERVRLLGGVFDVESAPGEGTVVTAALPEFTPAETGEEL
jgi:signal transduction histidine kinase